jgi:predicted GH43/DUF377 family glycosyl hydrolase
MAARPRARKVPGYVVEPVRTGANRRWEGHHATNPCAIRLAGDPRVFLGYRAGGDDDYYNLHGIDVWGSHLGLAVLDATGSRVLHRLPLPIYSLPDRPAYPRTAGEYEAWQQGPHRDEIVVLHDFRFWEDGEWLYLIYHEGALANCFDCVRRMRSADFLTKVERSIALASRPPEEIRAAWRALWWAPEGWQPCGVNGTNRIYASAANKNDIVFVRLADGGLRMYHRPVPDVAMLATGQDTFSAASADGVTRFGSLQTCIRPGFHDNSHIGNNGTPVRARVGEVDVFLDVVHGVHNVHLHDPSAPKWKLFYLPYLRLLAADTGECLYWSDEPILDADEPWREYVEDGEWVRNLAHLDGVMFAGGQEPVDPSRRDLDDLFTFYTGVGDTAVARAEFRLRDLLPAAVIEDIRARPRLAAATVELPGADDARWVFPERACGWDWRIENDVPGRRARIVRSLAKGGYREEGIREIAPVPGRFDGHATLFDGAAAALDPDLGWVVVYTGARFEEAGGGKVTRLGLGVLVLDRENPERVFYRSAEPLAGSARTVAGWTAAADPAASRVALADARRFIPGGVQREIRQLYASQPLPSGMTKWLRDKSGTAS